MKHLKNLTALGVAVASICLVANAQTNEWEKKTVLTVNAPIEIPGRVLEAGTYVMQLNNSPADRHIVQVYDKDQKHLITTILAIPNYRLQPTGKTVFTFWETPQGQPKALRAWFYPGDNFGQEFAYPKGEASKIATYTHTPVPTTSAQNTAELATAPVTSTAPEASATTTPGVATPPAPPAPQPSAAAEPAPAPPAEQAEANEPVQTAQAAPPSEPAPQTSTAPAQLPATGSNMPLVGLIGLIFLIGAAVVKVLPLRVR